MTGSGNDFVFFDGREVDVDLLRRPSSIREICDRHNGVGADGIVILERVDGLSPDAAAVRISYFNSDGSAADLCGNATLCSTALSVELGLASPDKVVLLTPAGPITGRLVGGMPEISLATALEPTTDCNIGLVAGELRAGFAQVGIPHLVVLCESAAQADLERRGPVLRWDPAGGPSGANVNWVSRRPDGSWRYRTFERGVEGETLACGTGAVATALLLNAWGLSTTPIELETSSGRTVVVSNAAPAGLWSPQLRGEGRVVFRGTIDRIGASQGS